MTIFRFPPSGMRTGRACALRCMRKDARPVCGPAPFETYEEILCRVLHQAGWSLWLWSRCNLYAFHPVTKGRQRTKEKELGRKVERGRGLRFGITKLERLGMPLKRCQESRKPPNAPLSPFAWQIVREKMLLKERWKDYNTKKEEHHRSGIVAPGLARTENRL